jgi:uncharacterized membrane protein YgcG
MQQQQQSQHHQRQQSKLYTSRVYTAVHDEHTYSQLLEDGDVFALYAWVYGGTDGGVTSGGGGGGFSFSGGGGRGIIFSVNLGPQMGQ